MRVPLQNAPEEAGACGEDDLVRHHLVLLTRKRHVQQLLLLSQVIEGVAHVGFKVVPSETVLITGHFFSFLQYEVSVLI